MTKRKLIRLKIILVVKNDMSINEVIEYDFDRVEWWKIIHVTLGRAHLSAKVS